MQRAVGHLTAGEAAAQCFALHLCLRDELQAALGIPLVYTLGSAELQGRPVFHTPIDGLERMLREGVPRGAPIKLHAWLTLPSHEIIDLTLANTYAVVHGIPAMEGLCMFRHPADIEGQAYHPQLLGEDFLRRIGALFEGRVVG